MDIYVNNITKTYGQKVVFSQLCLRFKAQEITCLMAPSGRGKTTLLRCIMGLTDVEEGEIVGMPKVFSAVFQEDRLCKRFSSYSNVKMTAAKDITASVIKLHFGAVGLEESMYVPVEELSGGMKRRVAIVRAVLAPGDVIVMDEPFKGMDMDTKRSVIAYLKKYTLHRTIILVTHDESDMELLEAKLCVM